jgi:arylsulfatase A-like enzyme
MENPNASAAIKAGLKVNGELRGGKHDIWEGGFRQPYLVRWPGKVPAGTASDDIVCLSDTLATFAGIFKTNIPPGNAEDSFDVSASWLGTTKPLTPSLSPSDGERVTEGRVRGGRDFVVVQDAFANYAIRQGPWKLVERENPPPLQARNAQVEQKIGRVRTQASKQDELFNLADDPAETKDVAAQHPDILERLRKLLAKTREQPSRRP